MVLNKRIKRDFIENKVRWTAMILIIAMSMALVIALCSASDCITATLNHEWEVCNVEDGSFETYIPLSKRNLTELSQINVVTEKMFYTDVSVGSSSTFRLYPNRTAINKPYVEQGRLPQSDNEIFIDKIYIKNHGLNLGDTIASSVGDLYICGIGCLPDYGYVKKNVSDVSADNEFSVAIVTDKTWNALKGSNKTVYSYAYKLLGGCTPSDLRDKLAHLKFDENAVKDTYLKTEINNAKALKNSFYSSTDAFETGAFELANGIDDLSNAITAALGNSPDVADEFKPLKDGAMQLGNGISEFRQKFGKYIDEISKINVVNISSFSEKRYNIRITDAMDDSRIGKQAALVCGIILIILLVYMLAIFTSGTIECERSQIGTLYALGYTKSEILSHYMRLPVIISVGGAILGTACGFLLTDTMAASNASLYSFPDIIHVFPPYLLAYGLGLPIVFSAIINYFVLSKKLSLTPLKMMRESPQTKIGIRADLKNISFAAKYKIRRFLREIPGNVTLFFGIFIAQLLIMFSVACYGSISTYINGITDDVNYNYMYVLKNPVSDLPDDVHIGYTRGFYVDYPLGGTEMEVTLCGIERDNPYFDFASKMGDDSNKVYMSDSIRIKFGYDIGNRIVFRDNADDSFYAFEIADEVKYGNGLYFFMNADAMRKAFSLDYFDSENLETGERRPDADTYYYNTVFSDRKLEFRHNMMLSEISKSELKNSVEKFLTLMWGMIVMLIAVSMIIFIAVMYLLMKLEIDRSSFSISLLKALGYSEKTVNSFYLGGTFYIMFAVLIIGIPLCKIIINFAYPFCVSNVNAGFNAVITPIQYLIIVVIELGTYFITRLMLVKYLRNIKMTEILKNRE